MGYIFIGVLILAIVDAVLTILNVVKEKKENTTNSMQYSTNDLEKEIDSYFLGKRYYYELKIGKSFNFTPDYVITIPKKEKYKYADLLHFTHEISHLIHYNEDKGYWKIHTYIRCGVIDYFLLLFFANPVVNYISSYYPIIPKILFLITIILYAVFLYDLLKIEINAYKYYILMHQEKNIQQSSRLAIFIQFLDFAIIGVIIIIMYYVILKLYSK